MLISSERVKMNKESVISGGLTIKSDLNKDF